MINQTTRLTAFILLVAVMTISFPGTESAHAVKANVESDEKTKNEKFDKIAYSIVYLLEENFKLEKIKDNPYIEKIKKENEKLIKELIAERDIIFPPIITQEIPEDIRRQMDSSIIALVHSDLPVYSLGINPETGNLDIKVESPVNIDEQIRLITGDTLPLNIEYGTNEFTFQTSSCNPVTKSCNPLIEDSVEDSYYGLACPDHANLFCSALKNLTNVFPVNFLSVLNNWLPGHEYAPNTTTLL